MEKEYILLTELAEHCIYGDKYNFPIDTDYALLLKLSAAHNLSAVCHCALQNAQNKKDIPEAFSSSLLESFYDAVYLYELQSRALDELDGLFSSFEVPYIVFKGSVLKELYPVPQSRVMGDVDLLIKPTDRDRVKKMLLSNGWICTAQNGPVYNYKKNGVLAEIHTTLINDFNCGDFASAFDYAHFSGYKGEFEPSYHMAYLIAHTAHHFKFYGAGIKHILDLAVIQLKAEIDMKKVFSYLQSVGLEKFAQIILSVCAKWFGIGKKYTDETRKTEEFLLLSGAFGGENKNKGAIIARRELEKGKAYSPFMIKLHLLFPSYSKLKDIDYIKFINGRPWLVPYAWVYRAVYNLRHRKKFATDAVNSLNDEKTKTLAYEELELFREIGLL